MLLISNYALTLLFALFYCRSFADVSPLALDLVAAAPVRHGVGHRLNRRDEPFSLDLGQMSGSFYVEASFGTPPQPLKLFIGSNTGDANVIGSANPICNETDPASTIPCSFGGTYSANDSSSYEYLNSNFSADYTFYSGSGGDYATDNFKLGNNEIKDLQFGISYGGNLSCEKKSLVRIENVNANW